MELTVLSANFAAISHQTFTQTHMTELEKKNQVFFSIPFIDLKENLQSISSSWNRA